MAHIPYGYRIVNGKAVVDDEAASKLRDFFDLYLSGLSIDKAKEQAGIPMSRSAVRKMLENEVYLGDDYYPAILDRETLDSAVLERERRFAALGNHKTTGPKEAMPVRTKFTLSPLPENGSVSRTEGLTSALKVAAIYSRIKADSNGSVAMNAEDREKVRAWIRG